LQGDLDDELKGMLWDLVNNQGEWWAAGKALECRQRLEGYWRAGTGGRDVFLLDTVLEKFVRMHCEGQNLDAMDRDSQVAMVELLLKNGCIAAESTDMGNTLASWQKMMGGDMWSKEGAMTTCAVIDRAQVRRSKAWVDPPRRLGLGLGLKTRAQFAMVVLRALYGFLYRARRQATVGCERFPARNGAKTDVAQLC
jgi:hypothetical protein